MERSVHIAHIGPAPSQRGGPAGYLRQLRSAILSVDTGVHHVTFPKEVERSSPPTTRKRRSRVRDWASRVRRRILGPPTYYRPRPEDIARPGGAVHTLLADARDLALAAAAPSLQAGIEAGADVLFTHTAWVAEEALARRRSGQEVWLFIHAPFPLALYTAWCWGLPERTWRDVAGLPDVTAALDEEAAVWQGVDRLVLPCEEALSELGRVHPPLLRVDTPKSWVLTGAEATRAASARDRTRWSFPSDVPIVLFLGNAQPYRGLDALLAGVRALGNNKAPGLVAVAGPPVEQFDQHDRLRPLGHVSDVGCLLASVDFVLNVNRFSLFDLSLIEAAEAGKPLLLHGTGGNLAFERLGAGVHRIEGLEPEQIAKALQDAFSMTDEKRARLGAASRRCYEKHLTLESFAQQHVNLYDEAARSGDAATR